MKTGGCVSIFLTSGSSCRRSSSIVIFYSNLSIQFRLLTSILLLELVEELNEQNRLVGFFCLLKVSSKVVACG